MHFYRESGKFGPLTIPALLLLVPAGVAAAFIYQRIISVMPLIYVNFLLTAGLGLGIGIAAGWLMTQTQGRNKALLIGGAVVAALAAIVASYKWAYHFDLSEVVDAVHDKARGEREALPSRDEIAEQFTYGDWVDARIEYGWSVGRIAGSGAGRPTLSGLFVWLLWIAEGVIILGGAVVGTQFKRSGPYCESCGKWSRKRGYGPWPSVDGDALVAATREGDVNALLSPVPSQERSRESARYVLHACPACDEGKWLDAGLQTYVTNKEGGRDAKVEWLVEGLEISPEEAEALKAYRYPGLQSGAPSRRR